MNRNRRSNSKDNKHVSLLGGEFPLGTEVYGIVLLLIATCFIWITITTCLGFLVISNFNLFNLLNYAPIIVKVSFLHTILQFHTTCLLTIHRPVFSTFVRVLKIVFSLKYIFFILNVIFLTAIVNGILYNWSIVKLVLEESTKTRKTDHCKWNFYLMKLVFNGMITSIVFVFMFFRYEQNVMWFPEITQSWIQELLPRFSRVMKKSLKISLFAMILGSVIYNIVSAETFILLIQKISMIAYEPIFESNIGQCTDEGLVEEILVNGSKLKFILSHLTSIFLHNVVSCFIYLGSAEVRRVIIFKIPGLFSDEALTFNLPIYKNALLTYNLSAKTSSWFQQIKNIGGNSFTNQRYDAFDRLNNFDTRSAIGKNSINNSVGGITSRESLLAAISIVSQGSINDEILNCDISKKLKVDRSTNSIWRILMINSRLRFESVLEQRVEAGVNNKASARVIKPLGLYPQLVRSVAFLKIRNLARYDPIGLLTMLMDEEQNNYDNIIRGDRHKNASVSLNPFHSWIEVVRIGTATIDSLSLNLQLVCKIRPLATAPSEHTYLAKGGTRRTRANMTKVGKRASNWMVQEKSLDRKNMLRRVMCYKYLPNWCRSLLWFNDEWQEIDPVQTHKRVIDDLSVIDEWLEETSILKKSTKNNGARGILNGNIFTRTPSQIANALFADTQLITWIIEALTEATAMAAARGHDGRADEAWKMHFIRHTLSQSNLKVNVRKLGQQYHGIVHQTVPTILCSLLECLMSLETFVSSPIFVGQKGSPPELEGNQLSRPQAIVLADTITRGIKRIVISFYEHLGAFRFPPEYAARLAKFARFKE